MATMKHPTYSWLSMRHGTFVDEYLVDLNPGLAYSRAGYTLKGKAASNNGLKLLENIGIQRAIQGAISARSKRTEITTDRVLREYARLAFSDMRDFSAWGPRDMELTDSTLLSDDDAACVAEVSLTVTKESTRTRVKLHDKRAALGDLAKHLKLFDGAPEEIMGRIFTQILEAREQVQRQLTSIAERHAEFATNGHSGTDQKSI